MKHHGTTTRLGYGVAVKRGNAAEMHTPLTHTLIQDLLLQDLEWVNVAQ